MRSRPAASKAAVAIYVGHILPVTDAIARTADHRGRILVLDSFRGLAALWVVIFHFSFGVGFRWFPDHREAAAQVAPFLFNVQGVLPVYLFFMISGFVILMTLERSENLAGFCVARFARLYPSFWVCLLITVSVAWLWPLARQAVTLPQALVNATMLEDFLGAPQVETVYWSLTHELVFYAFLGTVFALGWLGRLELIGSAWVALSALFFDAAPQWLDVIPWRVQLASGLQFAPLFFAGILIFNMRTKAVTPARLILLLACYLAFVWHRPALEAVVIGGFFVLFPLALFCDVRLARHPLLLFLGAISYPLYLVHQSLGIRVQLMAVNAGLTRWAAFAAAIVVSIAVAAVVHRYVERPAQRAIRRAWAGRRSLAAVDPA